MIDRISKKNGYEGKVSGVTSHLNSLVHGKPESAHWNYVEIEAGKLGHAVSMQINNPRMCDELCVDAILWIANLMGMMAAYFPDGKYENAKM